MKQNKVFIGALSSTTTEQTLMETFSSFGNIDEINLIKDRFTGESKGFAFIKYDNNASASKALLMNGKILDERILRVSIAQKKPPFKGGSINRW